MAVSSWRRQCQDLRSHVHYLLEIQQEDKVGTKAVDMPDDTTRRLI